MVIFFCIEVGNFIVVDVCCFLDQLVSFKLGDKVVQKLIQDVISYMVYILFQDGCEGVDCCIVELCWLGIGDFYVILDSFFNLVLCLGVLLGIFCIEEVVKVYVGQLILWGVCSVCIIVCCLGVGKQVFQLCDLSLEVCIVLENIKSVFLDQEICVCSV